MFQSRFQEQLVEAHMEHSISKFVDWIHGVGMQQITTFTCILIPLTEIETMTDTMIEMMIAIRHTAHLIAAPIRVVQIATVTDGPI